MNKFDIGQNILIGFKVSNVYDIETDKDIISVSITTGKVVKQTIDEIKNHQVLTFGDTNTRVIHILNPDKNIVTYEDFKYAMEKLLNEQV